MTIYKNSHSRYPDGLFEFRRLHMSFRSSRDLKLILHPYAFILKGGKKINKNLLDYQLLILQMNCPETIRSPCYVRKMVVKPGETFCFVKNPPAKKKKHHGV